MKKPRLHGAKCLCSASAVAAAVAVSAAAVARGVADVRDEQRDEDDPDDVVVEKIANAVHLLFSSEPEPDILS